MSLATVRLRSFRRFLLVGWLIHAGQGRARVLGSLAVPKQGVFGPGRTQRIGAFLRNPDGDAVVPVGRGMKPDTGVLVR